MLSRLLTARGNGTIDTCMYHTAKYPFISIPHRKLEYMNTVTELPAVFVLP